MGHFSVKILAQEGQFSVALNRYSFKRRGSVKSIMQNRYGPR
jgi:hypothetical protein